MAHSSKPRKNSKQKKVGGRKAPIDPVNAIVKAAEGLKRDGHMVNASNISLITGLPAKNVEAVLKSSGRPSIIIPNPREKLILNEMRQILTDALHSPDLEGIRKKSKDIYAYRYGLADGQRHTLKETAKKFGVTHGWVRAIGTKINKKMRQLPEIQRLRIDSKN